MASPASTSHSIGRALSPSSTVHISAESVDQGGIATASETPVTVAHYLGLTPKWVDGTAVGGCSFMIHVRHAAAAIASGLCDTVLITHGESGRSGVGRTRNVVTPTSLAGQPPAFPPPQAGEGRVGVDRWGRRLCSRSRCCVT
jgi:acetyl-CoA acetyltransferase